MSVEKSLENSGSALKTVVKKMQDYQKGCYLCIDVPSSPNNKHRKLRKYFNVDNSSDELRCSNENLQNKAGGKDFVLNIKVGKLNYLLLYF